MAAVHLETLQPADPMAAVRALNRMRRAGFALRLDGLDLKVSPFSRLTEQQRAYLLAHKAALVQLLTDAETVWKALQAAGTAGIGWGEGTPQDWPDTRLLAAGEVLYSDGRMVNRLDRRYATECRLPAPDIVPDSQPEPDISADVPSDPAPDIADNPAASPDSAPDIAPGNIEARIAELMAEGWAPWNAKAKARSEAEWRNREVSP